MIRNATRDELPALRELLLSANDAPYDIGTVAEEKCFGAGVSGAPIVRVFGNYEGVAVRRGKYLRLIAVRRDKRRQGIGSALLADAEDCGATTIAAEPGNYFTPGVADSDIETIRFFTKRHYIETAETHNLIAGTNVSAPAEPRRPAPDERDQILPFIEKHFGCAWRFEAARAFENDPPTIFVIDGAGFAAHEANNRGLGTFGPTGVVEEMRGRGLGTLLVRASLADLARLGYGEAVIPWTDAFDFYKKSCGARPAQRFVTLVKAIDSPP